MSGIQKKYLKYMCTLLILALVLSSICVWTYVRRNMTDVIVDKYEFMNEKMGIALDNLYRKTDAVTAEIILENDVQKSLNLKSDNVLVNEANKYTEDGKTPVSWNFSTMPSEEWKNGVGSALTSYAADPTDANWAKVTTAFVDGWAKEAAAAK